MTLDMLDFNADRERRIVDPQDGGRVHTKPRMAADGVVLYVVDKTDEALVQLTLEEAEQIAADLLAQVAYVRDRMKNRGA